MKRTLAFTCSLLALWLGTSPAASQEKPTLAPDDYDQWESLGRAALSPDGLWAAVPIRRVDRTAELRIHRTDGDSLVVVAEGTRPLFSKGGAWLAYGIAVPEKEREALLKRKEPVRNSAGLFNLRTGALEVIESVASFSFSDDGRHIAFRLYGSEGAKGSDLIVRNLEDGGSISFGNVSLMAWQDEGGLLAIALRAEDDDRNGVQLYDPASGRISSLDSDASIYRGLVWREGSDDLALLKTYQEDAREDTAHVVLAWRGLNSQDPRSFVLDPREAGVLDEDRRIVEHRSPSWSEDGSVIFVGVQDRTPQEQAAEDEEEGASEEDGEEASLEEDDEEKAGVEVWHSLDVDPVPQQRVRERLLRERNDIAAWNLEDSRLLTLGGPLADQVEIVEGGRRLLARDETPYDQGAMFGMQFHDLYSVNARTGQREMIAPRVTLDMGASPGGRYAVWFEGEDYWTYDLERGEKRNATEDLDGIFVNLDVTPTREQMPSFGRPIWLEGDEAFLALDEFDVWEIRADGSGGRRLTEGRENSVRYRPIRLDLEAETLDPEEPIYYSTYGEWTKKSGFSRAKRGETPRALIWEDAMAGGLIKASDADAFLFRSERFDDSPDYFAAGPELSQPRQVTKTNPFQENYAWGRVELVDYENEWGRPLQGALVHPAKYDASERHPMIVYHYEQLSQTMHRYQVPDPTRYYNIQIWSQMGYFVLLPDIVYRDRRPGQSNVETLRPAVAAAIESGPIDPDRVGLIGHSWGGYQTTYFVTQDDLFASAVAGAPLTNLMSMYLSFYWNSGSTDARIFEISQGRMQVPWWKDWDSYHANSPVHHIENLNTPLLIEFGTEDGAVEFNQGVEFYNAARREGKHVVMLVYEGENHGLAKEPNQRDYQNRILEWFGHYLKGEPAPDWILKGVPYIDQKDGKSSKPRTVSQ